MSYRYVDPQHLTDDEAGLYELVATFEYQGRPMTQEAISAATGMDGDTVAAMLRRLTEQDVLVRSDSGGQPAYSLARRDWSAAPGLRPHFPPGHGARAQEPPEQADQASTSPPASTGGSARPGQRQQARAGQVRAEHLRGEQERAEQARAELERHPEAGPGAPHPDTAGAAGTSSTAENGGAEGRTAGNAAATAPDHLMTGPTPQGPFRNAPDALIAQADPGEDRPSRARFVANTVPGKPDGEVDTRS